MGSGKADGPLLKTPYVYGVHQVMGPAHALLRTRFASFVAPFARSSSARPAPSLRFPLSSRWARRPGKFFSGTMVDTFCKYSAVFDILAMAQADPKGLESACVYRRCIWRSSSWHSPEGVLTHGHRLSAGISIFVTMNARSLSPLAYWKRFSIINGRGRLKWPWPSGGRAALSHAFAAAQQAEAQGKGPSRGNIGFS